MVYLSRPCLAIQQYSVHQFQRCRTDRSYGRRIREEHEGKTAFHLKSHLHKLQQCHFWFKNLMKDANNNELYLTRA